LDSILIIIGITEILRRNDTEIARMMIIK